MCDKSEMEQKLRDFRLGLDAAINYVLATGHADITAAGAFYGSAMVIARHVIFGETHEEAFAAEQDHVIGEVIGQLNDEAIRQFLGSR